jgi:membrane fusion protein (multidrug efflux system)
MKNRCKLKTVFMTVVLLLAGAVTAAAQMNGAGMPMPVRASAVEVRDFAVTLDAVGRLSASESADIRAEIAGAVKTINFSEGQPVKKGDSLINIDDGLIGAELMKAEAVYNVRKTAFNRSDKLKTSGYVSSQDWEQSSGSLQEAAADIKSAQIRLEKAKVLAPFDGVAGLRSFSAGDYVQVGQMLTTLDRVDLVKISFSIPEKNYADIKLSQKIFFSVDAWPGDVFSGEIYAVSPRVDPGTHSFDVKALIPNADGRLRPGMFARISIMTALHHGALVIPEQAIIPKGGENFVFAVRENKAVLQKVGIGLRQPGIVEITTGLGANESVVTAGIMKLQDGAAVKVLPP